MHLPPRVLNSLRLGVGASTLLMSGCDALTTRVDCQLEPVEYAADEAGGAEPAATLPQGEPGSADAPRLGQRVADAVRAEPREPVVSRANAPETDEPDPKFDRAEDPTAFVPFSDDPGRDPGERVERVERSRRPKPRPATVRPSAVPGERPSGWTCGPCGLG